MSYATGVGRGGRGALLVHLVEDGHQEGSGLARASLGARHHVTVSKDDRDRIFLHTKINFGQLKFISKIRK